MGHQEFQRLQVVRLVLDGHLALREAAERLDVCYRHAKRIVAKVRQQGPAGVVHGHRGRPSPRRLPEALRARVLQLATTRYADCNDTHCVELLAERDGLIVSRSTLRRWRRAVGQRPKRRHRVKVHRRRQDRRQCRGALVAWDGSPHRWLGAAQPALCLLAAKDEATGEVLAARFEPTETSVGYLRLLADLVTTHGLPVALHHDRHGALHRNDAHWTLEEELAGAQVPTHVGRALRELGIASIAAQTPQAKGGIERLNGVVQDRWVPEMRLAGIRTLEAANRWLQTTGIARYNRRFAHPPADTTSAFRTTDGLDLDRLISFRYTATVGNDHTIRYGGRLFDLPIAPRQRSYAKATVELCQQLDGQWLVYHSDQRLAIFPATGPAQPLQRRRPRPPVKPARPAPALEPRATIPTSIRKQLRGHFDRTKVGTC